LLAAIADSSNDAIFAKDLAGRYILFNRAACEFVGKAMDEVLGCDDHVLFPTEQADQLADIGRRVIAENRILSHEEVLATQDGERVFHATKGPLRDATGMVIGSFGISHDITQQKAAEARLNRLVADQAATLQAIPDLLFELDETGRYLDIKATQDGLLAAPREQLIGHTVQEMLPAAAADTVMAALDAAARAGTDYGRTITLPLPDGARHFELSVACKAGPEGRPLSFVVLSRDITARKEGEAELQRQAEELRVRNDELERFNRATIGRELDMIELKKQVNELCRQVGREPPYSLAFLEEPDA
jgi:PAS domain S-box-containing protein